MARKHKDFSLPSQTAWNAICAIREARQVVKSNLQTAEDELKDARREIDELGVQAEDSKEFQEAAARKERAERMRDAYKARSKSLADKMDQAALDAIKGEEKLFDDLDLDALAAKPTAKELYGGDDEDPRQAKLDTRPVGKPGAKPKPELPDPSKGEGHEEHMKASVNELDCREDLKGKLIAEGITTIGRLAATVDAGNDLAMLANLNAAGTSAVLKALSAYRKKHRKAGLEVERVEN